MKTLLDTTQSPLRSAPVAAAAAPPSANHIAFLDGLRGLAALWVLFGHAHLFTLGWVAQTGIAGIITNPALYLHFAVDIFIVLSGYCLVLPVLRSDGILKGGTIAFFVKRVRRILPTYYAAMAFCLILNVFVPYTQWARIAPAYPTQQMPLSVWLANLFLVQDVYQNLNLINGPFWSIAVEWHIYFLFPLLVLIQRRWGAVCALIVSALGAYLLTGVSGRYQPLAAPYYLFLFGLGMTAAAIAHRPPQWSRWGGPLLFALLGAYFARKLWWFPIVDQKSMQTQQEHIILLDCLVGALTATGLFVLATRGDNPLVRAIKTALSWRPLTFVGGFSYSLYLFHITFMVLIHHYILEGPLLEWTVTRKYLLLITIGSAVIMAACYGMYYLFERPFLTRKQAPRAKTTAAQPEVDPASVVLS